MVISALQSDGGFDSQQTLAASLVFAGSPELLIQAAWKLSTQWNNTLLPGVVPPVGVFKKGCCLPAIHCNPADQ